MAVLLALALLSVNGLIPRARAESPSTVPNPSPGFTVESVGSIGTPTRVQWSEVLRQTGRGSPPNWGFTNGQPVFADYAMDPEIVEDPAYRDLLIPALQSLPIVSLAVDPGDLFDRERGIYSNPRESGADWERPARIEFLPAGGGTPYRASCGIRIQGGWNRRPEESPKHAFRLIFRKRYGVSRWKAELFPDATASEFAELILRAGCNNTWLHWSGEERRRGDYLRDPWMRNSFAAMGHPSAHGRFVHLFLNGLYWGMYNLVERPSAPFVAATSGGDPEDYDVRNGSNVVQGDGIAWQELVNLLETHGASMEHFAEIEKRLNVRQFADYMLLNLYGANGDWDGSSNWYAARRRSPPGPFRFFVWDAERTLENAEDNVLAYDAENSPPRLFQRLRHNPLFRKIFAERAHLHLQGNGVLTPQAASARFRRLAHEIEWAVIAESARWGDYRRDVHPYKVGPYELYTRDKHWRPEIQRLLESYFPQRTAIVIQQLKDAGLFP